ncbi:unnamed protein product [Withania somnifera]
MAPSVSCHYFSSPLTTSTKSIKPNPNYTHFRSVILFHCSSQNYDTQEKEKDWFFPLKKFAAAVALSVSLISGLPGSQWLGPAHASTPALPDVSVLISGPPIKEPGALLRYALPIDNKAIREVQKPLEDITDSLKIAGVKALDSVERNTRQAARALKEGKTLIVSGLAQSKADHAIELLNKLEAGVEDDMVDGFPYEVPEEYQNMPLLKGRATVDMKVKVKDNPNLEDSVFRIVLDGYNAPVTAGNFIDLVGRHFYDGMEIQRADGFVVQTGDPEGPAEGFIDPSTEKTRTIPLEIMVVGEKAPLYGETLEESVKRMDLFALSTRLSLLENTITGLRKNTLHCSKPAKMPEFENNSASSQVFWLLKESELTPSNANILDGRYTVFGYVTENEDFLADLKVGDVIESIQVVSGLDNLVNPSYKIAG